MKNIYTLIHKTDNSKGIILYAALLAKDLKANLKIIYTQPAAGYFIGAVPSSEETEIPVQENLQKEKETAKGIVDAFIRDIKKEIQAENTTIEFESEFGSPSIVLRHKVEKGLADIIIIEDINEEGHEDKYSSNLDIVRNVQCPVLIIEPNAKYRQLKKIIYATDYQREDISTLKLLLDLTFPFLPEIIALHIIDNVDFEEKVIKAGFNEVIKRETGSDLISMKTLVNTNKLDIINILNEEATAISADLIVVLKENNNFLERIFKSSFTEKLISETKIPVLVFHQKKTYV